jgi:flagellar motor switch protein FliM
MSLSENFLSQDEIDALLAGVDPEPEAPAPVEDMDGPRPYNLATQERIVRGRMPGLELINDRFARELRSGFYNLVRRSLEVTAGPVLVRKYSDFIRNLPVPSNLNLVLLRPFRGTGLVVIDQSLVFSMVDNLFGGNGRFHTRIEGREFTQTEQRIIMRMLDIVFDTYTKAWSSVKDVKLEHVRSEINAQFVKIATDNEVVVTTAFAVELGSVSAAIHICFPYSMIEPVRDDLSNTLQGEAVEHNDRWSKMLTQQIKIADVEMVANIGTADMTLRDLVALKTGDVIQISVPQSIDVTVDSVPVLECSYGQINGRYALKVEKIAALTATDSPRGEDINGAE